MAGMSWQISGVGYVCRGYVGGNLLDPRYRQTLYSCGFPAFLSMGIGGVGGKFLTSYEKGKVIGRNGKKRESRLEKSAVPTPDTPDTDAEICRKANIHAGSSVSGVRKCTPAITQFTPDMHARPPIFFVRSPA